MKILIFILAALVGLLIVIELGLRLILGLGNPAIYIPDREIGYLFAPNQQVRRLGNRIIINQYSMRTHPIDAKRPTDTLRLFLIGDSIANGAWWTDQDKTISSLIEKQLESLISQKSPDTLIPPTPKLTNSEVSSGFPLIKGDGRGIKGGKVEVLNASANSWGPRNELAYLKRFGIFESQVIILLINTDDFFATVPTSIVVGRNRNYPDHKPLFALTEIISQFTTNAPMPEGEKVKNPEKDRIGSNLAAIKEIRNIAFNHQARFLLAMTPLKREIDAATQRPQDKKGRQRLADFVEQEEMIFIDFLPLFRQQEQPDLLFRDNIHLTERGNELVSNTLTAALKDLLSQ